MPDSSRLRRIAAAASALMLVAGSVHCDESDRAIGTSLGVGLLQFEFEEFDSQGRRLVKESGWLPGIEGRCKVTGQRATLSIDLAYYSGDVDYAGQTSAGVPVDSTTDADILDIALEAAYLLPLGLPPQVSQYPVGRRGLGPG